MVEAELNRRKNCEAGHLLNATAAQGAAVKTKGDALEQAHLNSCGEVC
jgi:hypothetical protein